MRWEHLDRALEVLSYDNARGVLRRGSEMVRAMVAVGEGRPRPKPVPGPAAKRTDGGDHRCPARSPCLPCLRCAGRFPDRLHGSSRHASPAQLDRLLHRTLIDAIVIGADAVRGAVLESLRRDYPGDPPSPAAARFGRTMPTSSSARTVIALRRCSSRTSTSRYWVRLIRRHTVVARRSADLLPLAAALHLTDSLQREAWRVAWSMPRWASTPRPSPAGWVSRGKRCRGGSPRRRTHLQAGRRRGPVGRGGPAPRATPPTVWQTPRGSSGFSSASLLQRTARRTLGVAAREVAGIDAERLVTLLRDTDGPPDWT